MGFYGLFLDLLRSTSTPPTHAPMAAIATTNRIVIVESCPAAPVPMSAEETSETV